MFGRLRPGSRTTDDQKRKSRLKRAAANGDSDALNELGLLYHDGGDGVEKDPSKAITCYEKAVAKGNSNSMNNLAYLLRHGDVGVPKDLPRALQLYERATSLFNTLAQRNLAVLLCDGGDGVLKDPARALQLFEDVAEKGQPKALNELALLLENGAEGVPKDPQRAITLYERAIDAGVTSALIDLAALLKDGAECVAVDRPRAVALLEQACDDGDPTAMNNLANLLKVGYPDVPKNSKRAAALYERSLSLVGYNEESTTIMCNYALLLLYGDEQVPRDVQKAISLFNQAADKGHIPAIEKLANIHRSGTCGIDKNLAKAMKLYERAAANGDTWAMIKLADMLLEHPGDVESSNAQRSMRLYEKVIELEKWSPTRTTITAVDFNNPPDKRQPDAPLEGDTVECQATWALAELLREGASGVPKDIARAVALLKQAIAKKHTESMISMANLLVTGATGLAKDPQKALQLYETAAEKGNKNAIHYLALLLEHGADGLPPDSKRAVLLYKQAIEKGVVASMHNLACLLEYGSDEVPADIVQSVTLFERAVENGDRDSMLNLSVILLTGKEGIPRDLPRSLRLFDQAVEKGNSTAMYMLADLLRTGDNDVPKDLPRALTLYHRAISLGDTDAMTILAALLADGDGEVLKDVNRSVKLYAKAIEEEHDPYLTDVSQLILRERSSGLIDIATIIKLYEKSLATDCEDAIVSLSYVLLTEPYSIQTHPDWDKSRAVSSLARAARKGDSDAKKYVSTLRINMEDYPEDESTSSVQTSSNTGSSSNDLPPSQLESALAISIKKPEILSINFLLEFIIPDNINTASDLLAAHNLVVMAMRNEILPHETIPSFGGSPWYLKDNLYLAASIKLIHENPFFVDAIFLSAEKLGIIENGYAFKLARGIRADMNNRIDQVNSVLEHISDRIILLEENVSDLDEGLTNTNEVVKRLCQGQVKMANSHQKVGNAVDNLSKSLNRLHSLLRKQNRREQIASVANTMLSLIPIFGGMIGSAVDTSAKLLFDLSGEDLIPIAQGGINSLANVDISDFNVMQFAFSEFMVSKLPPKNREQLEKSIANSRFGSVTSLRFQIQQTADSWNSEVMSLKKIPSRIFADNAGASSSATQTSISLKSYAADTFQIVCNANAFSTLSMPKAMKHINLLLDLSGFRPLSESEMEEVVLAKLKLEKRADVSELLFCEIFETITAKQSVRMSEVRSSARSYYDGKIEADEAPTVRMATQLINTFLDDFVRKTRVPSNTFEDINVSDLLDVRPGEKDMAEDRRVQQTEFVDVIIEIIDKKMIF